MSLMEKFANPELFASLSTGEKLAGSTVTMIMGMGITFLVLVILWGFIEIMGRISVAAENKRISTDKSAHAQQCEAGSGAFCTIKEEAEAIAAVICASVSAYEDSAGEDRIVVRKISKKPSAAMFRSRGTGTYGRQRRIPWMGRGGKI